MRVRKIKRIIDALARQRRMIVVLDCGHNMSVTEAQLDVSPLLLVNAERKGEYPCAECPDAPPEASRETNPLDAFHLASFGEKE